MSFTSWRGRFPHFSSSFAYARLAASATLVAADAAAFEPGTPEQTSPARSAQNFAVELRLSPYSPAVDEQPGRRGTPFRDRFGDAPRVALGVEVDWQTLRIPSVGTLGVGVGAGVVWMSRRARTVAGGAPGEPYGLTIHPLYLAAVLRADAPWRDLGIPVVPFAKVGLGAGVWHAWDDSRTARNPGGASDRGITWGTLVAVGASLPLDVLDPTSSRGMDVATGLNATHLFVEYYWLALEGLFQRNALYVGTNTWAAGVAFEF